MRSGKDVVGAAIMAPETEKHSSFRARARRIISWSGTMAEFSRTGMRSVRTACPEGVLKRVCRTFELAMYSRVTEYGAEGEILQRPPRSRSSIAAKMEDESNRGQQSHSTEP